eukprot:576366_1
MAVAIRSYVRLSYINRLITHSQHYSFCTEAIAIRVRTHNIPGYTDQIMSSNKVSDSMRHTVNKAIHLDLINIKSDVEDSIYPVPKELDHETIYSWISTIIKSTREGDIRAVQLISSTLESLHLSGVYPPIYHALIFGHGKLGDVTTMLSLYQKLFTCHQDGITASIVATTLSCLALHRRSFDAIKIFDEYLAIPHSARSKPDINVFCMMQNHCSKTANWDLSKHYFTKMLQYNIKPTALCFKYILETCCHSKPPKYEEALSILKGMRHEWSIEPNVSHFAAVIHTLATPYAYIKNPLSQDIAVQIENNNDFEVYKLKLLHGKLFTRHVTLSDSDLQRVLNLFDQMTDEYEIIPNDKVFGEIFYAMGKAHNLEMAFKYRKYWKHKFPNVRQQAYSFNRLLSICCNIASWDDALDIYHSTALFDADDKLYTFDGDSLAFQARHKVQPEIGVFNQLLRCNKQDISRQMVEHQLDKAEAETMILQRVEYIQSQMYHFRFTPNFQTWIMLMQCAAIVESKHLCNRFLKRMFQYFMKPHQQKHIRSFMNWGHNQTHYQELSGDPVIPNEFKDSDDTFDNCWDYYHVTKFECPFIVFQALVSCLYWSRQKDRALMVYHDFYVTKQKFTHWYTMDNDIYIDLHAFDPGTAAIALLYVFENEFESIYYNVLCGRHPIQPQPESMLELKLKMHQTKHKKQNTSKGRNLVIITGRGKGNEKGVSVLRPWIQSFLKNECTPAIKSYTHPRNVGVVVLDSTDVLAYIAANRAQSHQFYTSNISI